MDSKIKKILFTKKEILEKIDEVTSSINHHYQDYNEPVIMLGLLKGCINFFGQIMTKLEFDTVSEFIKTSVTHGASSNLEVSIDYGLEKLDVKGRKILILEDVIDSGVTLVGVKKQLMELGAYEVKVLTLLDKVNGRKVEFVPDWSVIESKTHDWLVGWGLDVNEWGRRFPYIGSIKDEFKY